MLIGIEELFLKSYGSLILKALFDYFSIYKRLKRKLKQVLQRIQKANLHEKPYFFNGISPLVIWKLLT